jgi:hypothetical protein
LLLLLLLLLLKGARVLNMTSAANAPLLYTAGDV